jgi:hypothetical protein
VTECVQTEGRRGDGRRNGGGEELGEEGTGVGRGAGNGKGGRGWSCTNESKSMCREREQEHVQRKQEQQVLTAIKSYSTMTNIDKFSERVNAKLTWNNKIWRYFSLPHKPTTPDASFVQALLSGFRV